MELMKDVELRPLTAPTPAGLRAMTFPAYRHLLDLEPAPRHPEQGDTRLIVPYGVAAWHQDRPVGLALAEAPAEETSGTEEPQPAQLLSVLVDSGFRNQGIGSALVEAAERESVARGQAELTGLYTTGRPGIEWMERIFARRNWETEPFSMSVRFNPATALTSPAFSERKNRVLSRGLEIFPWSELTAEEEAQMRESNERLCWIEPALEPWQLAREDLHWSSVGARYNGKVVGWVLNHSVLPGVVRFTISYMRKDLSRRGRILTLYRASLMNIEERGGCQFCTFLTPFSYPRMIEFIRRWIQPISSFVGESRKIRISLTGQLP